MKTRCQGKHAPGLALQRKLLGRQCFPQSGSKSRLSTPCRLSQEQVRFLTDAAAGDSSDSEEEQQEQGTLSREQLLACYGLSEDLLAQLVAKEKEAAERKKERRNQGRPAPEDSED